MKKIKKEDKSKKIVMSPEELVKFMMETWNDAVKNLTIEELDLKFVNQHYDHIERRLKALEKRVFKIREIVEPKQFSLDQLETKFQELAASDDYVAIRDRDDQFRWAIGVFLGWLSK